MKAQKACSAYKLSGCKIRNLFCIVKGLRWFILLWPVLLSAQWSFDFEENSLGTWSQSPLNRWEASSADPLNGRYSMHHNYDNPVSGEDYAFMDLNYPVLDSSMSFSFRIRHAYNPSSGNNWQVYFLSQQASHFDNAFVFGVNFKGSDDLIKLWQLVDGDAIEMLSTGIDYEEDIGRTIAPLFTIERDSSGFWKVGMDATGEGIQFSEIGIGKEIRRQGGKYFGVRYSYSSAQDRKLWLDDVVVDAAFYEDNDPPILEDIRVTGLNCLNLKFSEKVIIDKETDFQWNGLSPDSVSDAGAEIRLFFPKEFPNREMQFLHLRGIPDLEENRMVDTLAGFMQNLVQYGEIVINEIMSDPEPAIYLPVCEYVELLNLTDFLLDMTGWTLMINSKSYKLDQAVISPKEYLLLTANEQDCQYDDLSMIRVFSSKSALSNSGAEIMLFDQHQRLIHMAEYKEMSYYNQMKGDGGWSLERIDPERICGGIENWSASLDISGGTPGRVNSVLDSRPDLRPPGLNYIGIQDDSTILLHFSEPIFISAEMAVDFRIDKMAKADPVFHTWPIVSERIELRLPEPIKSETIYTVNISEISDCEDNKSHSIVEEFMLPQLSQSNNIIINELMYDAFTGQQEYLELYNPSAEYIDLKDLKFGISSDAYSMGSLNWLSDESRLLPPGSYVVFTKNEIALREDWNLGYDIDIIELSLWKNFPNQSATLSLVNRSDIVLERFIYHDSMHHNSLMDPSGVSLERMSDNIASPAWTSAAASANYGTPGTRNSQWIASLSEQYAATVDPSVFSPDMDGYKDICEIIVEDPSSESLISIFVTDLDGVEVRKLIENGIPGTDDRYFWNGHDESNHLVLPGLYIIHIRISQKQGVKVIRKSCAVIYR